MKQTRVEPTVSETLTELHEWVAAQANEKCASNVFELVCEGRGYRAVQAKLRQMIAASSYEDRRRLLQAEAVGLMPNASFLFSVACLIGVVVLVIVLVTAKVI